MITKDKGNDPTESYHKGNPESAAAWASMSVNTLSGVRRLVLDTIRTLNGATCDELEILTGLSHQTISARCTELSQMEYITKYGKRPTRSGRMAAIWKVAHSG